MRKEQSLTHRATVDFLDQFMAILPAGSTTRRDGILDIASHTPVLANPPDLGPKGYFSQTSDDRPGGSGSTKQHSMSSQEVSASNTHKLIFLSPSLRSGKSLSLKAASTFSYLPVASVPPPPLLQDVADGGSPLPRPGTRVKADPSSAKSSRQCHALGQRRARRRSWRCRLGSLPRTRCGSSKSPPQRNRWLLRRRVR